MARLYEYQGKDILKKAGVSVPKGICVSTAEEAKKAAKEIGKPVALRLKSGQQAVSKQVESCLQTHRKKRKKELKNS